VADLVEGLDVLVPGIEHEGPLPSGGCELTVQDLHRRHRLCYRVEVDASIDNFVSVEPEPFEVGQRDQELDDIVGVHDAVVHEADLLRLRTELEVLQTVDVVLVEVIHLLVWSQCHQISIQGWLLLLILVVAIR